jgi:hypothetical protein
MPPNLRHAPVEDETLAEWVRRQRRAVRKPIPPRGITQTAPARVLDAMTTAINKKKTPVAPDAFENTNEESNHV